MLFPIYSVVLNMPLNFFLVMVSLSSKLVYIFSFYLTEMLEHFQAVCKSFFKAFEDVLCKQPIKEDVTVAIARKYFFNL